MNVDWGPVVIVGGLAGSIGAGIWLAGHIDRGRQRLAAAMRREQNIYAPYVRQEADSIPVGDGMPNIAMSLGKAWPCDHIEENWCSGECQEPPRGRHHVVHVVTDLPEPDDEWWTR